MTWRLWLGFGNFRVAALEDAGVPDQLLETIGEIYGSTWLSTQGAGATARATLATTPGDPLEYFLFNFIMAALLRRQDFELSQRRGCGSGGRRRG